MEIFDPAYSSHSELDKKVVFFVFFRIYKYNLPWNLHLVGCATVCSKSEITLKKQMSSLSPCFPHLHSPNLHFMMIDTFLNKWSVNLQNFPTNILFFCQQNEQNAISIHDFFFWRLKWVILFFWPGKKCFGHLNPVIFKSLYLSLSIVLSYGCITERKVDVSRDKKGSKFKVCGFDPLPYHSVP